MNDKALTSKRLRARYVIVVKGYSQKEAAQLVGISEKTMTKWVRKYDWNNQKKTEVFKKGGFTAIMEGYLAYVKQVRPSISADVSGLWDKYLQSLKKELEPQQDG